LFFCTIHIKKTSTTKNQRESTAADTLPLLHRYLYFCTSKANKLSTAVEKIVAEVLEVHHGAVTQAAVESA
jgi:hypothetical protein